jgi:hypothetical protein
LGLHTYSKPEDLAQCKEMICKGICINHEADKAQRGYRILKDKKGVSYAVCF